MRRRMRECFYVYILATRKNGPIYVGVLIG
jgi:predicted GIY-YIG superfamily endonuclease